MTNLRYLRIEGQAITTLPHGMENLVELRTLSLDNNRLTTLPYVLRAYCKLYSLSCKKNQIETIEENYFDPLKHLEGLYLDNNNLKRLP